MNNKGQFSVISALLVAVILIATVIMTFSTIRNARIQDEPKILSAIDETNFAIKQILGFTVGYYCSVLQVTGNSTYARNLTMNYLESGLTNLANIHPEWGTSLNASNRDVFTYWFTGKSFSTGSLAITYNLTGLGVYGVSYETSCKLMVEIQNTTSSNQARLMVTKDEGEPILTLGKHNFKFYRYKYTNSTWEYAYPVNDTSIKPFSNGTYVIDMPSGLDSHSYVIQVEDQRGLSVAASSFDKYICTMNFSTWTPSWWDTGYSYREPILVINNVASPLSSGYSVRLNINTSSLVSAGKISASGNDLRIVRWNGSSWSEIDRDVIGMNTSSTQVWFKTQAEIGPSPAVDYSYYVYYGNSSATNPPANRSNVYLWFDDFSTNTTNKYDIDRHASNWHGSSSNVYYPFWDASNAAVRFDTGDDYVGGWMPNAINETDVYAEMKMDITGSYPSNSTNGILLRWQNKTAFLGGDISGGFYNSSCVVKDRRDPDIAHATPAEYHPWNVWFTIAVAASGTNLRLWVNGVSKVNATDTRVVPGKISFLVAQAKGWMDDFKIRKYVESEPSASVTAEEAFSGFSLPLQDVTMVAELLQNGTMRWLGQNLQLATQTLPIPPIPVKAIHINQTVGTVNCEVPFQVEDWASEYKIPLGLTNNASLFSSTTMLVFLVNSSISNTTIWWDGSDQAIQTPLAYTSQDFAQDDVANGILTNGNHKLILSQTYLYVDGFDFTSTSWTEFGTSPYLNDDTSNYIRHNVNNQKEAWFTFQNLSTTYSQIFASLDQLIGAKVRIEFECIRNGTDDYFDFRINDGTTTYGSYSITPGDSYDWRSYDITGFINTTRKINNAKIEITYRQSGPSASNAYVRRCRLFLDFWLTSVTGNSTAKADFFRINTEYPVYGAAAAYVIHHGIVRDIVQQEAEWGTDLGDSGGAKDCPNVYAHIVLTLPAIATYYTYQLRLMFVDSQQSRNITDLCPIRLVSLSGVSQTENGTSNGYPIVVNGTGTFYNCSASIWQHHWSQFISATKGAGLIFTDSANQKLYIFDTIAGASTGAIKTNASLGMIELLPATIAQVNFTYAFDVTWHGAVVTFDGRNPIYPDTGGTKGLWLIVESPPSVAVSSEN